MPILSLGKEHFVLQGKGAQVERGCAKLRKLFEELQSLGSFLPILLLSLSEGEASRLLLGGLVEAGEYLLLPGGDILHDAKLPKELVLLVSSRLPTQLVGLGPCEAF